jgi:cytochrome c peroxidase
VLILAAVALLAGARASRAAGGPVSESGTGAGSGGGAGAKAKRGSTTTATATPAEQAALVAEGKELFNSVDAFGQQPSQGPTIAGLKVSCQTCHAGPAFTDNRTHVVGPTGSRPAVARQTPHLLRIKDTAPFAWDGRNPTLQKQIRGAITSPLEMNGSREPTAHELDALAAFVETLDAPDAVAGVDFDPVLAEQGKHIFEEPRGMDPSGEFAADVKVACASCHTGDKKTDRSFHKILMPFGDPVLDPGAMGDDGSIKGFKTPVLRALRLTAPYFHEGLGGDPTAMRSPVNSPPRPALLETVGFYNERFQMNFTPAEEQALIEYLMSL